MPPLPRTDYHSHSATSACRTEASLQCRYLCPTREASTCGPNMNETGRNAKFHSRAHIDVVLQGPALVWAKVTCWRLDVDVGLEAVHEGAHAVAVLIHAIPAVTATVTAVQ